MARSRRLVDKTVVVQNLPRLAILVLARLADQLTFAKRVASSLNAIVHATAAGVETEKAPRDDIGLVVAVYTVSLDFGDCSFFFIKIRQPCSGIPYPAK